MTIADYHVVPVNDLREHDEARNCWCRPRVEAQPGARAAVVTHHSMDGRELVEKHGVN